MSAELVRHDENAPAVLCAAVPGCPKGFRVLVNVFGGKRMRATLGFPGDLTKAELSEAFLDSCLTDSRTIPPEAVADADRKSVVEGKSVSVRVDIGGRRNIKKKKKRK